MTKGVEDALEELRPGLSGMRTDTSVFRPATLIEDAIDNLTLTWSIAGVLLALIVAAFLFEWRTVFICLVTIPVSLVAAALVLDLLGETFNAISFAGLAVAIAIVIDDAVVGVENVARRLRQHREAGSDRTTANIVREASQEMRSPLAYATFIVLLAIVPVAVMEGRPGAFFEPLVLSLRAGGGSRDGGRADADAGAEHAALLRGIAPAAPSPRCCGGWRPATCARCRGLVRSPRAVLVAAGRAVVVGLAVLPLLGTSLIPSFKDRDVLVRLDGEPGTSNPRMTRITTQVSRELRRSPGSTTSAPTSGAP